MPRPAQYIQNTNDAPLAPVPASSVQVPAYPGPVAPQNGQWTMPGENLADWRYSALDQITTHNVRQLKLAWTFSTGTLHGEEAAPLVVGSTLYFVTPYPNILYALDLTKDGALKWKFNPHPDPSSQGVACCDTVRCWTTRPSEPSPSCLSHRSGTLQVSLPPTCLCTGRRTACR